MTQVPDPDEILNALPALRTARELAESLDSSALEAPLEEIYDEDADPHVLLKRAIDWAGELRRRFGKSLFDRYRVYDLEPRSRDAEVRMRRAAVAFESQLDDVENVLGEFPESLSSPPLHLLTARTGLFGSPPSSPPLFRGAEDDPAECRRRLYAACLVLQLHLRRTARWILERLREFDHLLVPRISPLGPRGRRNSCEVIMGGRRREAELPPAVFDVLGALIQKPSVVCPRYEKRELVKEIPELAPWIRPTKTRSPRRDECQCEYMLDSRVKAANGDWPT